MKGKTGIGGIMLWAVSWDQNNIVNGRTYSEYAFHNLKDTSVVDPTTAAPTQGPHTTVPTTLAPSQGKHLLLRTKSN